MKVWFGQILLIIQLGGTVFAAERFGFDDVRRQAEYLSKKAFVPSASKLPEALAKLNYLEHQQIKFRPEKALWRTEALPFQVEFFHPGYVNQDGVSIAIAETSGVHPIPFASDLFSYGANQNAVWKEGAFSGFRIVHPLDHFGEVATFLGASYFRMIGLGQSYGSSARGIAVNTSVGGTEEFPKFRDFWLKKPAKRSEEMVVLALMDGPSVTGAFEFAIRPGPETVANVRACFFPRTSIREFGVAALTSMFLHDQNSGTIYRDFRPAVHDADGLLMQTGRGERIWRPLDKGRMIRVNDYADDNPKGFGLMQRDRDFEHYQDLVAHFEKRPSVWVKPIGNWGRGSVRLVQFPSDREFFDNVVAFWVPATPPKPGESIELSYQLFWGTREESQLAKIRATRIGDVIVDPPREQPNVRFVIDFEADQKLSKSSDTIQAAISCGSGAKLVSETILQNQINHTVRLVIEITRPAKAVDLSAFLKRGDTQLTETWNFTWQP